MCQWAFAPLPWCQEVRREPAGTDLTGTITGPSIAIPENPMGSLCKLLTLFLSKYRERDPITQGCLNK